MGARAGADPEHAEQAQKSCKVLGLKRCCALCRSGSDSEDSEEDAEREKKPVPKWARRQVLIQSMLSRTEVTRSAGAEAVLRTLQERLRQRRL